MGKKKSKPIGCPPRFTEPEEMQVLIDEYFERCKGEQMLTPSGEPYLNKQGEPVIINAKPPTITGLALALGFTSRQALLNYQAKDAFVDTVTRAKSRVEMYCEERLFDKDGQKGAAFALSHNFRWVHPTTTGDEETHSGVIEIPAVKNE